MTDAGSVTPRRVQYSSCDQCRKSRVACDAEKNRRECETIEQISCSRCLDRGHECSFEWIRKASVSRFSRQVSRARQSSMRSRHGGGAPRRDLSYRASQSSFDETEESAAPAARESSTGDAQRPVVETGVEEVCDALTSQWLRTIYAGSFETVFGSWMGKYSNPFLFDQNRTSEICVSISFVCEQLDRWIMEEEDGGDASELDTASTQAARSSEIAQSLDLSILAYAARWLPLVDSLADIELVRRLWRAARRDMLKVINRPSYRSVWTLLLFALTPIPSGIGEDEAKDGVSGQVCVHAALQQIQQLRARQKSLRFNGAQVNITAPPSPGHGTSPNTIATAGFMTAESTAYWAALTFDTSASLTLNCRSLLSSGLFGAEFESWWLMVKTCREIFHQSSSTWLADAEMTDDRANRIIAAGSSWKLMVWKLIANLKEALRDGHDEHQVRKAFSAVQEGTELWNKTYRDLLAACQRRILFLEQETKLRWYIMVMHYHLSVLIAVDMLFAAERNDLLTQFAAQRIEAEGWVLNCLVFGLNNKYTISQGDHSVTIPIMAIDPYPHHIVAAVKLIQRAIDRDYAAAKLSSDAYDDLVSTLSRALRYLPASSKSVQVARSKVQSQTLYSQSSMGG